MTLQNSVRPALDQSAGAKGSRHGQLWLCAENVKSGAVGIMTSPAPGLLRASPLSYVASDCLN